MNFYSNYFFVTFSLTEFDLYVEIGDELFKFEREKIALLIRLTWKTQTKQTKWKLVKLIELVSQQLT